MANLTVREHILNDLLDLKQDFERVFHHVFKHHVRPMAPAETFFAVVPPIETWVDTENKELHLSVALPGIKPEALNITLQGNLLTFTGEQKEEEEKSTKNYLQREFSYERFTRSVTLPDGVDGDKMTAELKDGILQIKAPIAAAALPKKIAVKSGTPTEGCGKEKPC
jgi:HSP20 family protein